MMPGRLSAFGVQHNEVWFWWQYGGRRELTAVEAPGAPDPLGEMVFRVRSKMNVPAHGPGGLLSSDDQGKLAAARFGRGNQSLSRRFMVED